jgi:hypothetical protein
MGKHNFYPEKRRRDEVERHGSKQVIDARPSLIYRVLMICAFPRRMKTIDSRGGVAVGPEGMRVR